MKQRCPGCYWAMRSGDKYFCPIFSCPKREPSVVRKLEIKIERFKRRKLYENSARYSRKV